ncbi:MAG: type II secretion system protein [Candidatus Aminicenantes bacterium]|nr:MAG: type II secretion system protein [Candidatus Aminicenantes bacterium]
MPGTNKSLEGTRGLAPLCKDGFTLIEVLVSITILFLVIASVFYFYSHLMDNQAKLKEKYKILRMGKEFVDSFIFGSDPEILSITGGQREVEDFILRWNIYPAEDERAVLFTSGVAPMAQLKRVHLEIIKAETGKSVLDLHFLVNTISPAGK